MSLVLQSSGGGSVTLQEAVTASNLTITVPAVTGTMATLTTPSFVSTIGVGGATPAASGAGITFPSTQSASSDANTLDDYEEGTWTPNLGGNTTYTERFGQYVKVGRLVTVWFDMTVNSIGTGSTGIIYGLPFTSGGVATGMPGSIGYWSSTASSLTAIFLRIDTNSSQILTASTSGNQSTLTNLPNIFGNSARLIASASYYANS
jgi:hypothetical protein